MPSASTPFTPAEASGFPVEPRRILVINPNTSQATTERLSKIFSEAFPSQVHLDYATAQFGASYIACEASHAVAGHAVLDIWARMIQHEAIAPQAVLIACFGDPGLFALRESSSCPVTGLAEASFIEAAAHGPFAIVTGGERWRPMLHRLADNLGYGQALRHIETVQPSGAQLLADPDMALQCLGQACQTAAATGVKSIIMGGAGLAGYASQLQASCPVPLIDSALAGLRVLLSGAAPKPARSQNGFVAQWKQLPAAMSGLQSA